MTRPEERPGQLRLSGNIIVSELLRNMELGKFEMSYSVLLPCSFTVYLNPSDHGALQGIFEHIVEDARQALRARVVELNGSSAAGFARKTRTRTRKDHKIACTDWVIDFLSHPEIPVGDVEIHSELNETAEPEFRGVKTTLVDREPSVKEERTARVPANQRPTADKVFAEIRYTDNSGPQVFLMTKNEIRIGRGGEDQPIDVALSANDEVSREHLRIRRNPATNLFFITDLSTNGTWLQNRRLRKGDEEALSARAEVSLANVVKLAFQVRP